MSNADVQPVLTISSLEQEIRGIIVKYHVYGAECIVKSLVRACQDQKYLTRGALHELIEAGYEEIYFRKKEVES